MTYQLAIKLLDAGWPRNKIWFGVETDGTKFLLGAPTLSDLIEACGDKFLLVEKLYAPDEEGMWWAKSNCVYENIGNSPEEAVAILWLTLKKQNLL